jgi:hypothetical protein
MSEGGKEAVRADDEVVAALRSPPSRRAGARAGSSLLTVEQTARPQWRKVTNPKDLAHYRGPS